MVNGYSWDEDDANPPLLFNYPILFYVEVEYEPITIPSGASYKGISTPPRFSASYSNRDLLDPRASALATSQSYTPIDAKPGNIVTVSGSFTLPANQYAIISPADMILKAHDDQNNSDYNYSCYPKKLTVYYSLDFDPPNRPDAPWVPGAYVEETAGIKTYFMKDALIPLCWQGVDDVGTGVTGTSGSTKSGTAGYKIYKVIGGVKANDPIVVITSPDQHTANIDLFAGEHELCVTAYDVAGNEGPPSPSCKVAVDRTPPQPVTGVRLRNPIQIPGKGIYANAVSAVLEWDQPADNDAAQYEVLLDGAVLNTMLEPSISLGTLSSGTHRVAVSAVDRVGNKGEPSTELGFSVDASAPQAPDGRTFTVSDPSASVDARLMYVNISSVLESFNVTFTPAADGAEAWQSGMASHEVYRVLAGGSETLELKKDADGSATITVPFSSLVKGETTYRIYCVDAMGNKSVPLPVRIMISELSPVRFPVPCYTVIDDVYWLRWLAPESVPPNASVSCYKVILKTPNDAAPSAADFDAAPQMTATMLTLAGKAEGEEWVAYIKTVDTLGNTSTAAKTFKLPPRYIEPGEPYVLTEDEYWWSGLHEMHATVVVPVGVKLTVLPDTLVRVFGNSQLLIQGTLRVEGLGTQRARFESDAPSYKSWQGIYVEGLAFIDDAIIRDALRGVTVVTGAQAEIKDSDFIHNRVGLHSYGESPIVTAIRFEDCEWYGVKEDAVGESGGKRPAMTGCVFKANGYDYYRDPERNISMDALNLIPGNSGNRKE